MQGTYSDAQARSVIAVIVDLLSDPQLTPSELLKVLHNPTTELGEAVFVQVIYFTSMPKQILQFVSEYTLLRISFHGDDITTPEVTRLFIAFLKRNLIHSSSIDPNILHWDTPNHKHSYHVLDLSHEHLDADKPLEDPVSFEEANDLVKD